MESAQRKIFRSTQDWHDFFNEIILKCQEKKLNDQQISEQINSLRTTVYKEIEKIRGRPLFVYATDFLVGNVPQSLTSIVLEDVGGFTDLVNAARQDSKSVDILLHSPGGAADVAERIVSILKDRFDEVHFLVPHSAYSAATMLALSGNTITLHKSATLGPIDPQIDGTPARSIKRGFEKVEKKLRKEGAASLPAYIPLIEKYSIHLLELCDDLAKLSEQLVSNWLEAYMFKSQRSKAKIKKIVKYFSNYDAHLLHSRPITFDKLHDLGLTVHQADEKLNPLLWETYILLNGFFGATDFVKLYESSNGLSWGKKYQQPNIRPQTLPQQMPPN